MLDQSDIGKNWTNLKQMEGNERFPTVFKFNMMGSIFYGAKSKGGEIFLRKALATLQSLTGISIRNLKKGLL